MGVVQIKSKKGGAAQTISPQNFMHDQNYVIDSFITKFFFRKQHDANM